MDVPGILTRDLAFLAASATVGIYAATARLTLIGWLFQYKDKLKSHKFVKHQICGLNLILLLTFASGTLALYVLHLRAKNDSAVDTWECVLYWALAVVALALIVFHGFVEIYRLRKKEKTEANDCVDILTRLTDQLGSASKALNQASQDMEKLLKAIKPENVAKKIKPVDVPAGSQNIEAQPDVKKSPSPNG